MLGQNFTDLEALARAGIDELIKLPRCGPGGRGIDSRLFFGNPRQSGDHPTFQGLRLVACPASCKSVADGP